MTRILVVDDEPYVCEFLKKDLSQRSYDVITANSGKEALEKVKKDRPHVMLLDIRMPGLNGIEVLKKAKALDPALAIIMVTAIHDEEIAKRAMAEGADDYVTKPMNLDYLYTSLAVKVIEILG